MLQRIVICFNVLQCASTCVSVLHCASVCCSVEAEDQIEGVQKACVLVQSGVVNYIVLQYA